MRVTYAAMACLFLSACGEAVDDVDGTDTQTPDSLADTQELTTETIYADALISGIEDWSWATHNLGQTAVVHGGTKAISFEPDGWAALFFQFTNGIDTSVKKTLTVWTRGTAKVDLAMVRSSASVTHTTITGTGAWIQTTVDFAALGLSGIVDGFWFQDTTGGNQAVMYVDDMAFTTGTASTGTDVTVSVDRTANRRAVNPEIYGVNFGENDALQAMKYPVRRWGGNHTTRYSWETDTANRGLDWYFLNVPESNGTPALLPQGSAADVFIDEALAATSQALITVPTIGWTPKDRVKRWSYSVAKYGAQQSTECTDSGDTSWCEVDAGNGVLASGTKITADPLDTSKAISTDFVQRWIAHIQGRVGTAANGGVRYYALDNEPTLWNQAHRDVHPNGLTYDELWQKTLAYGKAVKAADPQAKTFGPAEWGWCGYLDSTGGCGASQDKKNHGDLPMLAWYLKNVCEEQTRSGVRVVDYLDIHYYPQATNVSLSSDESAATQALRLRSVKSLYDASYVDESWIGEPVKLIPRMKAWIASYCPGTKLAITEYHFGNDDGISAALAQAEVLAVFGREGVDLATRWVAPESGTLVEDAFKLFLNYDGAGTRVTGTSVKAASSNVNSVASYAVEGADGILRIVLVNHDTLARNVRVQSANARTATLYGFEPSKRLAARGSVTGDGTGFTVTLPARSATVASISLQ